MFCCEVTARAVHIKADSNYYLRLYDVKYSEIFYVIVILCLIKYDGVSV